jgi:hypothetical protein
MEFRLIYRGRLPAEGRAGGRAREKHLIRKVFHKQLKELWKQDPALRQQAEQYFLVQRIGQRKMITPAGGGGGKTWLEHIADNHERLGTRFVPLISEEGGFTCSLDILFLRRDNPGSLIIGDQGGGDIDNRIKVLLDGLKIPKVKDDLGGLEIKPDENPFFCLLDDDKLITSLSLTTDRLLIPQEAGEGIHDVCLIVRVTVINPSAIFAGNRLV